MKILVPDTIRLDTAELQDDDLALDVVAIPLPSPSPTSTPMPRRSSYGATAQAISPRLPAACRSCAGSRTSPPVPPRS